MTVVLALRMLSELVAADCVGRGDPGMHVVGHDRVAHVAVGALITCFERLRSVEEALGDLETSPGVRPVAWARPRCHVRYLDSLRSVRRPTSSMPSSNASSITGSRPRRAGISLRPYSRMRASLPVQRLAACCRWSSWSRHRSSSASTSFGRTMKRSRSLSSVASPSAPEPNSGGPSGLDVPGRDQSRAIGRAIGGAGSRAPRPMAQRDARGSTETSRRYPPSRCRRSPARSDA